MTPRNLVIILALMTFAWLAFAQANPPASTVHVVSPRPGEKLSANFVTVRYELLNPAANANTSPNFRLRIDGGDPVTTTDTEHTFTGLQPGAHTVLIDLVDANGTPVNGTHAQVQFVVIQQPQPTEAIPDHTDIVRQTTASFGAARLVRAVFQEDQEPASGQGDRPAPQAQDQRDARRLPHSSTALPLLSLIGLGVLIGGLASAMRTR